MGKPDDWADFLANPAWFVLEPLPFPNYSPELAEHIRATSPGVYERYMHYLAHPPVTYRRKPVPFVLPIRGGFADGEA